MKAYIVALEVCSKTVTQWIAPWQGDPGRTCLEKNAKRYTSVRSAIYGLAHARRYRDFPTAEIIEINEAKGA